MEGHKDVLHHNWSSIKCFPEQNRLVNKINKCFASRAAPSVEDQVISLIFTQHLVFYFLARGIPPLKPLLWWRRVGRWVGEEALIVSCKKLKRLTIASKTCCHKNWPTSCSIKRQLKNTDTDPRADTQWHDMTQKYKRKLLQFYPFWLYWQDWNLYRVIQ